MLRAAALVPAKQRHSSTSEAAAEFPLPHGLYKRFLFPISFSPKRNRVVEDETQNSCAKILTYRPGAARRGAASLLSLFITATTGKCRRHLHRSLRGN